MWCKRGFIIASSHRPTPLNSTVVLHRVERREMNRRQSARVWSSCNNGDRRRRDATQPSSSGGVNWPLRTHSVYIWRRLTWILVDTHNGRALYNGRRSWCSRPLHTSIHDIRQSSSSTDQYSKLEKCRKVLKLTLTISAPTGRHTDSFFSCCDRELWPMTLTFRPR